MFPRLVSAFLFFSLAAWSASGLTYSTYLRQGFTPTAIATDSAGNVYMAGSSATATVPVNDIPPTTATVVKLDPNGAGYVYVRNLGGSGNGTATGIAVDSAGNAYVTGTTSAPDYPITMGPQPGTNPATITRAFLAKLDPQGGVVFSELLGNVTTSGLAVAVTPQGAILVSGISSPELTATPGAYNAPNPSTTFPPPTAWPYLMELDATGANVIFTATGIGGSALALDAAGNIYMGGSTDSNGYPTTPGAYQTNVGTVVGLCMFCGAWIGTTPYVTKVDPAASQLIYSTGAGFLSSFGGLAVDAAGNAYVTGQTVGETLIQPFLSKLDPAGANLLYTIPIGGAGVELDSQGDVYVGGAYNDLPTGFAEPPSLTPPLPLGVTNFPAPCGTNAITSFSEGTISRVDAATGNVLSTVMVDGSSASVNSIAYAGNFGVWAAGSTAEADTPITPGASTPASLVRGPVPGAFLSQANFGLSDAPAPQIACILDTANLARPGLFAPNQLISLFGSNLGPATGVAATDYATTSLAGVSVTFDGVPAVLIYVSSSQINVAVPAGVLENPSTGAQNFTVMQVSVNGGPALSRELPVTPSNPSIFADLSGVVASCTMGNMIYYLADTALAVTADGAVNSCSNLAGGGDVISLFVNGLGVNDSNNIPSPWVPSQIPIAVSISQKPAQVVNVSMPNPFVSKVDVIVPPFLFQGVNVTVDLNLSTGVIVAGPLTIQPISPTYLNPGTPFPLNVWLIP